jgi:hypothetical protein
VQVGRDGAPIGPLQPVAKSKGTQDVLAVNNQTGTHRTQQGQRKNGGQQFAHLSQKEFGVRRQQEVVQTVVPGATQDLAGVGIEVKQTVFIFRRMIDPHLHRFV